MQALRWSLVVAMGLAGCAGSRSAAIPGDKVASLPAEAKSELTTLVQVVDTAKANVSAADVAHRDAQEFREAAQAELRSARSRVDAAESNVGVALAAGNPTLEREAQRGLDVAQRQHAAAKAKVEYADKLVDLRRAQCMESEALLSSTRSDLEVRKLRSLQQYGLAKDIDADTIFDAKRENERVLAERRQDTSRLSGEVAGLEESWRRQQRAYDMAARGGASPVRTPVAPPEMVPPQQPHDVSPGTPR